MDELQNTFLVHSVPYENIPFNLFLINRSQFIIKQALYKSFIIDVSIFKHNNKFVYPTIFLYFINIFI